jgi:hypothetical protein
MLAFSVKERYQLNYFICIKDLNVETITSLKLNWFSSFIFCCQQRHKSIGVFVVYIDTRSSMPNIPSKSRDLADANTIVLTEWK